MTKTTDELFRERFGAPSKTRVCASYGEALGVKDAWGGEIVPQADGTWLVKLTS